MYIDWKFYGNTVTPDYKKELIRIGRLLYQRQYIVASEGNLSYRIDAKNILITRRGICKGELTPDDLIKISLAEERSIPKVKPSTEMKMHLEAYSQRPDIKAVIHAHPPYAVSLTLAGISLNKPYTPESVLLLGAVPTASYSRPSTSQVAKSIQKYLKKTDIILLERHGSLTIGKTLAEAFWKLEILENTAKMIWLGQQAGRIKPLPQREVKALLALRREVYGLEYPIIPFR